MEGIRKVDWREILEDLGFFDFGFFWFFEILVLEWFFVSEVLDDLKVFKEEYKEDLN